MSVFSKSKKGHNSEKTKMHFELSPLIVWIALWIVNKYSEFQVNIFSNNQDITKCEFHYYIHVLYTDGKKFSKFRTD